MTELPDRSKGWLCDEEWVDGDGYPTRAAISRILLWESTPLKLAEFISSIWWPGNHHLADIHNGVKHPNDERPHWQWKLSTGGWSGNEEIIASLDETFFWMKFWYSTVVGGHYTFYLPEPDAHRSGFWGDWRNFPEPPSP